MLFGGSCCWALKKKKRPSNNNNIKSKLRCQVIFLCSDLCPGCRKKTSLAVLGSGAPVRPGSPVPAAKAAIPDSCREGSEPQSPGRRSHGRGRLEAATSAKRQDFRGVNAGVSRKKGLLLQMSRDYLGSLASPVETAE